MNIESGTAVTNNGVIYVGSDSGSNGTLNISGGTVDSYWLKPGYNTGSAGVVNISGGVVRVSKPSGVSGYDESEIGSNGSGKITVSGDGKLIFTGTVRIANMGKAESFIDLEDNAEMTVKSLFVGQRGKNLGSMTLSGNSKLTIENQLNLGTNSGSKGSGTMTLKDNAAVTLGGTARSYVGYNSGTSTLNISDNASFTATGTGFLIGEAGTGVINQTGGTISLTPAEGSVFLADAKTGKADLNISGGKFNIGNRLVAGTRGVVTIDLSGTGEINVDGAVVLAPGYETTSSTTVNQTDGTFNANGGIVYGNYYDDRGTGVYDLSGGTLNTTSITYGSKTPASASFILSGTGVANIKGTWDEETETQTSLGVLSVPATVSGGTLNVDMITIPSGKALTISGGTIDLGEGGITAAGAYTFNLSGGTFTAKDAGWSTSLNAVAADNSTITFAPEADQTISWNGAFVNDSQSAKIIKNGGGTFKINSSDQNNPTKLESLTVSAGRLDFAGTMTGDLAIAEGAYFSPGNGIGTLTLDGDLTAKADAHLVFELGDDTSDLLVLGSGSTLDISDDAVLELLLRDGVSGTYTLIEAENGFGDYADAAFWTDLLTAESDYFWNLSIVGNSLLATADPNVVPEPATWVLLVLGSFGLLYCRKK